ncbi:maleylpyruvate isomerase family mycothiol-dependent enzyme [Cellulosimicrobium protaetiae]|uniref:Maleylpyruvate isomerase family mycothiol-dependent enzyme n=2 Tax=Cellulosimicrobium protaetiae TaxID=2587808 RepID=A0A6M5ULI6_9MICO|nr:maleylpyruvate isomerase family mycothiol-dependent enzyme [Cellulosimicrobium protaetiae]
MAEEDVWAAIATARNSFVDLVAGLDPADWERPSLCTGWRVHDVAAHLTLAPTSSRAALALGFARALLRGRASFDGMMDILTRDAGTRPREEILAALHAAVGSHHLAPGTTPRVALVDALVHTQDVAVALGIDAPAPPVAAREAAERVWAVSFPFRARQRLAGFRLVAADVSWRRGEGQQVTGSMTALLLLLTGRPAALAHLDGDGARRLARSLAPHDREELP